MKYKTSFITNYLKLNYEVNKMRKAIIAGNWKMHYTPEEAVKVINELKPLVKDATCDVVVCPTFVCLDAVLKAVKDQISKLLLKTCTLKKKELSLVKLLLEC